MLLTLLAAAGLALPLAERQRELEHSTLQELTSRLRRAGQRVAGGCSSALASGDLAAAQRALSGLREEEQVLSAAIIEPDGRMLAVFDRDGHRPARVPPRKLGPDNNRTPQLLVLELDLIAEDGSSGALRIAAHTECIEALCASARREAWAMLATQLPLVAALWWLASGLLLGRRTPPRPTTTSSPGDRQAERSQRSAALVGTSRTSRVAPPGNGPQDPPPHQEQDGSAATGDRPPIAQVERHADVPQNTILVAEDHVLNRRVTVALLEREGYRCEIAEDGLRTLEVLQRTPVDLILMDCLMPGMDGFEATRRIRSGELGSGAHVPIVAMTASATGEDRERCLEAGMDDYVPKPMSSKDLMLVIQRWLGVPSGRTPERV